MNLAKNNNPLLPLLKGTVVITTSGVIGVVVEGQTYNTPYVLCKLIGFGWYNVYYQSLIMIHGTN